MMGNIDSVHLDFDPSGLVALNIILALIMFGVALDLRVADFRNVMRHPKAVATGLTAQLLILPALTFAITMALDLPPSVELGMILVAACPGGNVSNFLSSYSRGNASLSISMTAVVTTSAIILTPLGVSIWGNWNPATRPILQEVSIDPVRMIMIVALIIGIPVVLGMALRANKPEWADRLGTPFKIGSLFFLGLFIVIALAKNTGPAIEYIPQIAGIVIAHNFLALLTGRLAATVMGLSEPDRRTLTIEVGIQNSGLGLVLIFSFFDGLGGMAIVAAFWGIWHLVSGLSLATYWRRKPPQTTLT